MGLEIRLLGPPEVTIEGTPVRLTGRLRTLLLVLAVSTGRAVTADRLAEATWGDDLPRNPRATVHTYLTRLRRSLGADLIETGPAGYLVRAGAVDVDAVRFLELLDLAASVPDATAERALLDEALALWRGTPFEGVQSTWLATTEAPRLVERYLAGVERRVDLDLASGRLDGVAAELVDLASRHPLRESLSVRLLAVLDRSGRRAEALEQYESIRVQIADQLGADPGPELQARYAELLSGGGPDPPVGGRPGPAQSITPRQLPADVAGFVGRDKALGAMDGLLDDAASRVVIVAIAGAAGIGKTALAVHWAHRVADRFPDGQLHANLRGFDPAGTPRSPAEVLRGFLDTLQVPPQRIPSDVEAQAALYRSVLAGRRMLVVLDNARDAGQVRMLLPGSPGCLVVVTSRDRLTSLIAVEGACPVTLDVLSAVEARQLLDRRIGPERVSSGGEATSEIIDRCASLPLALTVVAARAVRQPEVPLSRLAAQLRKAQAGLSVFAEPDPVADLRAVFSWSFRTLSAPAARLFRLLGLHPGPDVGEHAAASLAGLPLAGTRPLLAELTSAHLIAEPVPGRYAFHDLLRAFAAESADRHESATGRRAATHRLLDHYVHSGYIAAMLLYPQRDPIALAAPRGGVGPERFESHHQAFEWCVTERPVLLAMVAEADATGFDTHAWQLAWSLVDSLDRQGFWTDIITTQLVAIAATDRLADRAAGAHARRNVARAYGMLGRHDEAHARLREALELYGGLGDRRGLADTHRNICRVFELQGRLGEAIDHARQALRLYQATGDRAGEARVRNSIGWLHGLSGDQQQALVECRLALAVHQEVGNLFGEAVTLDSLGFAHHHLGQHDEAIACYLRALALLRDLSERFSEAETLEHLGDTYTAMGNEVAARRYWQAALDLFVDLGHADADQVRAKLREPPGG